MGQPRTSRGSVSTIKSKVPKRLPPSSQRSTLESKVREHDDEGQRLEEVAGLPCLVGQFRTKRRNRAHAGSRTRVTSMAGLYDTVTLHARCAAGLPDDGLAQLREQDCELRQVVSEFQITDARENLDVRLRVANPRGLSALNPG